jgi:hypothetical protein
MVRSLGEDTPEHSCETKPEETEEQKILRLLSKAPPAVRLAIITLLESCVEGGENL